MMVRVLNGPSVAARTLVLLEQMLACLHGKLLHPLQGAEAARRTARGAAHQAAHSEGNQQRPAAQIELQREEGREDHEYLLTPN